MTISFKPCSLFILLLLFPRPPFLRSVFVRRPSLKLDHPASLNPNEYVKLYGTCAPSWTLPLVPSPVFPTGDKIDNDRYNDSHYHY